VGKITGKEGLVFEGKALCFDCEEDMLHALEQDQQQFRVSAHEAGSRGRMGPQGEQAGAVKCVMKTFFGWLA